MEKNNRKKYEAGSELPGAIVTGFLHNKLINQQIKKKLILDEALQQELKQTIQNIKSR